MRHLPNTGNERGAALVEFALCSVLFFTLIFGITDFGLAIWRYNMTADLAQEGARWAAVRGSRSTSPATAAQVQSYVQTRAPGMTVTVTTTSVNSSQQCTATSVNPSAVNPGNSLCVRVQASYTRATPLIPIPSMTLQSQAKMVVAR